MPNEEPTIEPTAGPGVTGHAAAIDDTAVQAAGALAYEPPAAADGAWLNQPEELPRRPRRRLLAPLPIALLIVLLTACGFIGGVLVEKGQGSSSGSTGTGAAGLASRFAALRGGATVATGGASNGSSAAGGSLFGRAGGASGAGATGAGAGASATTGQVAYVHGSTLYVTTAEGNTVKVRTSPTSTVTKTVKADVKGIHPGETVLITGAAGANGAVSAESIRVGASGGGGLASLFGRAGGGAAGGRAGAGEGGGEPALFGKGG
jgi:hypothetical protein